MTRRVVLTLALPDGTGAHKMCHFFACAFIKHGYKVSLLCGKLIPRNQLPFAARTLLEELEELGVEVNFLNGFESQLSLSLLYRVFREVRGASAVVCFNQRDRKYALGAGILSKSPVFVHVGNLHKFHGSWLVRTFKELSYRLLIRKAALLVCVSTPVADEVVTRFGVEAERIEVLYNGIRLCEKAELTTQDCQELRVSDGERVLLAVGRLDPQKGHDLLLQAFARVAPEHPDIKLYIVGEESRGAAGWASYLEALAQRMELSDKVKFLGWHNRVSRLLKSAHYFVSASRWEGSPLALLEAMNAGLPVLFTDCSGDLPGFQQAVHGLVVKCGDLESLEQGLSRLLKADSNSTKKWGIEAQKLVSERYDIERVARNFVTLIESRLQAGALPPAG
jgi:glycosyltransferase involved in cell wall biosynthesis